MYSPFQSVRTCREPGCLERSCRSGFCRRCYKKRATPATSDGKTGGKNPKMTPEQVAEAKRRYACFETKRAIARHFGVDIKTLNRHLAKEKKQ